MTNTTKIKRPRKLAIVRPVYDHRAILAGRLDRLFASNRITNEAYGRAGDARFKIVPAVPAEPDADAVDPEVQEWRDACGEVGFPQGEPSEPPETGNGASPVSEPGKPPRKPRTKSAKPRKKSGKFAGLSPSNPKPKRKPAPKRK